MTKALITALNRGFAPKPRGLPYPRREAGARNFWPLPTGYCGFWASQGLLEASVCVPP